MHSRLLQCTLGLGCVLVLTSTTFPRVVSARPADRDTTFVVRIENISSKDGQPASNGTRWPFALSPGLWVVHDREVRLFKEGSAAGSNGLEMQAEDGNPSGLVDYLRRYHSEMQHGVYNTPLGATSPGPIGPGGTFEFSFAARAGMKLSLTSMFGQSNDWFYAPEPGGIKLFENGRPVSGDITSKLVLWDAGTEKDEELGVGPNQGPRQKAANTGDAENGVVRRVKSTFVGRTDLFRVTITPQTATSTQD
ncbi:MAG: spondin domain-containing protein [Vicinamibacterales bacterium]